MVERLGLATGSSPLFPFSSSTDLSLPGRPLADFLLLLPRAADSGGLISFHLFDFILQQGFLI